MKLCPECRREYYDDSLLYCLDDGSRLLDGPGLKAEWQTAVLARDAEPPGQAAPHVPTSLGASHADGLYFQARFYSGRDNPADNEKAIELLESAVALDPDHALSHIELARAYNQKAFLFTADKEVAAKSYAALQKAFMIGSHPAEAYEVQGFILWNPNNGFPHEQVIDSYKKAIAQDANLVDAHNWLAAVYFHVGLLDEAEHEIRTTLRLDPGKNIARLHGAMVDGFAGRYREAIRALRSLPPAVNPLVTSTAAWCHLSLGQVDAAADLIERSLAESATDVGGQFAGLQAMVHAARGRADAAERSIRDAVEKGSGFGHFHHTTHYISAAYALMGQNEKAMEYLCFTADNGFPCFPLFANDPNLNRIRADEAFKEFLSEQEAVWRERGAKYGVASDEERPTAVLRTRS